MNFLQVPSYRLPFFAATLFAILLMQHELAYSRQPSDSLMMRVQDSPLFPNPTVPQQNIGNKPLKFDKTPLKQPLSAGILKTGEVLSPETGVDIKAPATSTVDIDSISIEGNKIYRTAVVSGALNPLKKYLKNHNNQIDSPTLEKYIKNINAVYPFKLQGDVVNSADNKQQLKFDIYESSPIRLSTSYANSGRPGAGGFRWGTEISHNSITGYGDTLAAEYSGGVHDQQVKVSYTTPIYNRLGGSATGSYYFHHTSYDLQKVIPHYDNYYFSNANNISIRLNQPLDYKKRWALYSQISYVRYNNFLNHKNINANTDDYVILQGGVIANFVDKYGKTTVDINTLYGVSSDMTRQSYVRELVQGTRVFNLPHRQTVTLRGAGQTGDYMPIGLDMSLGGPLYTRGYTPYVYNGDRGYRFNLDYMFPIPGLKKVCPKLDDRVRGVLFTDMGQVWVDKSNPRFVPGKTNHADQNMLISAGLGFRARLTRYFQGYIDLGYGIQSPTDVERLGQPTVRAHFGIRSDLLDATAYKTNETSEHQIYTAQGH